MCVLSSLSVLSASPNSQSLENVRTEGGFSLRHLRHDAEFNGVWDGWTRRPRTQPPSAASATAQRAQVGTLGSSYKHTGFSRGSGGQIRALQEKGGEPEQ